MSDSRDRKPPVPDRNQPRDLSAWERWELPLLDQQGNEVAPEPSRRSREEERDVKPLTAADIEAIRQSAWEEGLTEGREQGHQEGLQEGRKKGEKEGYETGYAKGEAQGEKVAGEQTRKDVTAKLDRLEALMAELLKPIERHQDELESALVNLATVVARAVIFRELSLDSSQIRQVITEALAQLPPTEENVKIRINPGDAAWVTEVAERLDATVSITEDPAIMAGGCKVETRHSLVDYTVEKRFQKAVQGMLEQQLSTAGVGESEELDAVMGDLSDFHHEVLSEAGEPDPQSPPEPVQEPPEDTPEEPVEEPPQEPAENPPLRDPSPDTDDEAGDDRNPG